MFFRAPAFNINRIIVPHPNAFGSLYPEIQTVGSGRISIMAEHNGLPISTFNNRSYNIPQLKLYFGIGMLFATQFYNIIMQSSALSCSGGQMNHAVTAVNIQHGAHGSQTVSGIQVAITVNGVVSTPLRLRITFFSKFNTPAVGLFTIVEFYMAQVVLITTLAMEEFPK